uniref:Piwi-like protein 1 n=1 Tax=Aceria tosichella TaxID=561515 RepID=A0A6G1SM65_9ACAR
MSSKKTKKWGSTLGSTAGPAAEVPAASPVASSATSPVADPSASSPVPSSSGAGRGVDTNPVRGRGGFRQSQIRTIPETAKSVRVEKADGTKVTVLANFVPIVPMKNRVIQMYRIDVEPVVESESKLRYLVRTAAKGLFKLDPIYDGSHECRSGEKLAAKTTSKPVVDSLDGQTYLVKFTHTGTTGFGPELVRTYNMHMNTFLKALGYYSPQPGLYVNPNHFEEVSPEIMLLRGFRTSANMHEGKKMLMNLEGAHKLVQKQNVLTIMNQIMAQNRGGNLAAALNTELAGKIVVTNYNKRCYRIEDIEHNTTPNSEFVLDGKPMKFVDFYRTRHNVQITNLTQRMLRVVPNNQRRREQESKVTLLVPELCNIAGLTEQQRNDFRLKRDLIQKSQVSPTDRVRHLRQFLQTFHGNAKVREDLNLWGYSYDKDPCSLSVHVLPQTGYAFGTRCGDNIEKYLKADEKTANINVRGLAVVPVIKKMAVITPRNLIQSKPMLFGVLESGFKSVGLEFETLEQRDIQAGDSPTLYGQALRQLSPDTNLAIVIMQNQRKDRYDAIKKAASLDKGLITQVVTSKLLLDPNKGRTAAQKIAIQIAAKVGGEPWWVNISQPDTMICGYDTYHDTTKRGRSFGAFVASLNNHHSRWWSKADAHERLEEISSQMSVNIISAMKVYKKFNNNKLPQQVIIYRDGVGEGQIEHVFKIELDKIKQALSGLGSKDQKIKLTMIVVNKRIGARFYMRSRKPDEFLNPPPGTVIDHTVTREERFDFFLISQSTFRGTVTPTYYNIIHDECGLPPLEHQKLAHKLCLLYYNWSGTVRVPAPCQYAHKLALLCGEHLHEPPNSQMDDKLHYL